jgi:hypothetical protein
MAETLGVSVRRMREIGAPTLSRGRYHAAGVLHWALHREKKLLAQHDEGRQESGPAAKELREQIATLRAENERLSRRGRSVADQRDRGGETE